MEIRPGGRGASCFVGCGAVVGLVVFDFLSEVVRKEVKKYREQLLPVEQKLELN